MGLSYQFHFHIDFHVFDVCGFVCSSFILLTSSYNAHIRSIFRNGWKQMQRTISMQRSMYDLIYHAQKRQSFQHSLHLFMLKGLKHRIRDSLIVHQLHWGHFFNYSRVKIAFISSIHLSVFIKSLLAFDFWLKKIFFSIWNEPLQ